MANQLWERYENQWTVNLNSAPVQTPVFSPCHSSYLNMWFMVENLQSECKKYNSITNKNELDIYETLSVLVHKSSGDCGINEIIVMAKILYGSESGRKNCLYSYGAELSNFSGVLKSCDSRYFLGTVRLKISENGLQTVHGSYMTEQSRVVTLKCSVFISGHLGSIPAHSQLKGSLNSMHAFLKDHTALYDSKSCSDLEIHIDDHVLLAHKFVLAAHSSVFKMMMEHSCIESNTNVITITDATFEVFECFLEYLYSGCIPSEFEGIVDELYALADKYDVTPLKDECVRTMAANISLKSIYKALLFAYDSTNDKLKEQTKLFAVKNFPYLKLTSEWKSLVKSHPEIAYDIAEQSYCVLSGEKIM